MILLLLLVQKQGKSHVALRNVRFHNIIIVYFRVPKRNQLLQFLLLRKQGNPVVTMMSFTVHMYYSEHRTSVVEHFEMVKPTPHVPPPKKAR